MAVKVKISKFIDLLKVLPVNTELVAVLNFPAKVLAFLLRCSTVCERALGVHIPHCSPSCFHPQLPPCN